MNKFLGFINTINKNELSTLHIKRLNTRIAELFDFVSFFLAGNPHQLNIKYRRGGSAA